MFVIEPERVLRGHISSVCIPNLVYGKDLAGALVLGDSVREIVDLFADERLELSNGSFGEPVMREKRSVA